MLLHCYLHIYRYTSHAIEIGKMCPPQPLQPLPYTVQVSPQVFLQVLQRLDRSSSKELYSVCMEGLFTIRTTQREETRLKYIKTGLGYAYSNILSYTE